MDISNIIFYVLAVCMALFSVLTVTTRSIVRAATYLLFVLFGTAGLYFCWDILSWAPCRPWCMPEVLSFSMYSPFC